MGTHKNTLTINGKVLDITSGWQLGHRKPAVNIDGFVMSRKSEVSPRTVQATHLKKQARPVRQHSVHASSEVHRRKEHSKTLMRTVVTKPESVKLSSLSARVQSASNSTVVAGLAANFRLRHQRAMHIKKNQLVSKFGRDGGVKVVVKKSVPLHVKQHPANHTKQTLGGHVSRPIFESLGASQPTSPSHDIIAAALSKATAHESKPLKHSHAKKTTARKTANGLAIIAVILALGGFIAYQNVPNIEMRLASSRAGVAGQLPGYKPAGFAMSRQIKSLPGQVVVSFNSTSDKRNFNISQSASDWNSQTLLDSYVALKDQHYQAFNQPNGKTIYVYGDSNATWVDGGTWYNITGNSSLNNDQLLKLANSF